MKKFQFIFVFTFLMSFAPQKVNAQIDTVFWFAAPWVTPNHANNVPVVFRLSSFNSTTSVRLYQPAGTYDTTVVIPPNSLTSVYLSHILNTLESWPADNALNYGIKIEADTMITAVYEVVTNVNNPETYSLKGSNGMGNEFVTPFQTSWNNGSYPPKQPKQMFCIIATEDNTTVWITPKAAIVGHPAGVTYSITLNKGQVYTAENVTQATATPGNNLSGSIIVSNKPISVTISDDSVANVAGGGCRDLMGDQIVPTDVIGKEYIVNKGSMNVASQESFYVVATENFTSVSITNSGGTITQLLNQGDTYRYIVTDPLIYVVATKPVYLLQASGFGCELGAAILPPLNCAGSSQVSFTRTNGQSFFINILCPTSATGNFTLNGSAALVPPAAFSIVPGTGGLWSGAQIQYNTTDIPAGSTNLIENSTDLFALGVINGGSTSGCLFHYMSSFLRRVYTKAGVDQMFCNGQASIPLNGSVSGGSTTGVWQVLNGTGTFSNPNQLVSTYTPTTSDYAQGELTFVLSSTGNCIPVNDTMKVSFIQSPVVNVGADLSYCKNNIGSIPIAGSVLYASAGVWTGGIGGSIGNSGSLNTTYTPSPTDLANDSVALFLESTGSFFSCPSDKDTLVIYFTEPPVVVAGPDLVVCSNSSQVTLGGSVSGASTTGTWSSNGSGAFSPTQNNLNADYLISIADTTAGVVMLTLTSTNNGNCAAVQDSLQLSIVDQPDVNILTQDTTCATVTSLNLNGTVTGGFPSTWSVNGAGTIANPNMLNTTYAVSIIDTVTGYIDLILATGGACPSVTDSIRVFFIEPPVLFAGNDVGFCDNENILLNGIVSSGFVDSIQWTSLGTGQFSPSNETLNTTYIPSNGDISSGNVTFVLSPATVMGCLPENDTVVISFKEVPNANFSFTQVCLNNNTPFVDASTINAGTITSWSWNFGDAGTSITQNPSHNYNSDGNFNATLIVGASNGCFDTITQQVQVYPLPEPSFVYDSVCELSQVNIYDNSSINSGSIVSWVYDFYAGATSTQQNPVIVYPSDGVYPVTLTATSNFGCVGSNTINVTVNPQPNAAFNMNPNPALVLENVTYTDQTTGNQLVNWYWNFGDGQGDNIQNTNHAYSEGGTFDVTLIVTDVNGCMDTVTQQMQISLLPVLPTGFSPNGDGENDVFIIRGGPFKSVNFKIYNNWGEFIFESNAQADGWDGSYKNEPAPLGVYTWTFTVEMPNGQLIKKSGDVTLIR